jgi:hypothetical protein
MVTGPVASGQAVNAAAYCKKLHVFSMLPLMTGFDGSQPPRLTCK